jgi:hypothetical protein
VNWIKIVFLAVLFFAVSVQARTWTSPKGKTLEGDFVEIKNNKVHVLADSGKLYKISPKNLIEEDFEYAQEQEKPKKLTMEEITSLTGVDQQALIISGFFHIFVVFGLFKLIFGDIASLFEAFKYSLKPDWVSWWQGEGMQDFWNEMKLGIFLFLCVGLYFVEVAAYRVYL